MSTFGILFFGTPHRGTDGADLQSKVLDIISVLPFVEGNKQVLKHLGLNSEKLWELSEDFLGLHSRFQIVSFRESKRTPIGLFSKLVSAAFVLFVAK